MNIMDYNNNNNEDIIENYYQPRNMNSPTYPMYSCPLCNYPMPMRGEYYDSDEYDDPDEHYDLDEYDDPGYRQRHGRRRRSRRRSRRRYPRYYGPSFYPWLFLPFFFPFRRF